MGALDHFADYLSELFTATKKLTKRKPMATVEIKVKMDCDGCERRVKNTVSHMRGVRSVEVKRNQSKLTVKGYVEPNKVLRKVRKVRKKAEFWPYVEHNLVAYPYAKGAYDKKAPSGHVRNVVQAFPTPADEQYTSLFSDDNPHACSIM